MMKKIIVIFTSCYKQHTQKGFNKQSKTSETPDSTNIPGSMNTQNNKKIKVQFVSNICTKLRRIVKRK